MDETLFIQLLELRKYLLQQVDVLTQAGLDINSAVISRIFESASGINKHIESILGLKPFWQNETTLSWALEFIDENETADYSDDTGEHKISNYHELWLHLQDTIRSYAEANEKDGTP